jgi:DNA topoisomerase-1
MPKKDFSKLAKHAGLHYTHDDMPGISRKKSGKIFVYKFADGKLVKNKKTIARINSLKIPPAWTDVWICADEKGHMQATGRDSRGRKQYLYHPKWAGVRDSSKYDRMLVFSEVLPKIRRKIAKDLNGKGREKVLAAVVEIMEKTLIRVGNEEYVKDNNSFGLTTIRNRHADVHGEEIHFHFKGKSGVLHDVRLDDVKLAKIVLGCQEIPGQELFCFRDDSGKVHDINSHDVNDYLKESGGEEITAKDFRTWYGTLKAMECLMGFEPCDSVGARKKNVVKTVTEVALHLRNTKAVCRKSYINPNLIECYLEGKDLEFPCRCKNLKGLHSKEHMLVHFLENN